MRTWLYDRLRTSLELQAHFGWTAESASKLVVPQQSGSTINLAKPFVIYGLGNNTNEDLSEDPDHQAHRQFFTIQIHDGGASYLRIDEAIPIIKRLFQGVSHPPSNISQVRWLENSAEFDNQTYNTIFRYMRFQAIISKGVTIS